MVIKFTLKNEYIELVKLLKAADLCSSGGTAKIAVVEGEVMVDGVVELRKGRKIRPGQQVEYEGNVIQVE
ncbi:MAG: RNA-binding S4 domain-containing protein [Syntrophobacteraceae bacterium]